MDAAGPSCPRKDPYPPYVVYVDGSSSEDEDDSDGIKGDVTDGFPLYFVEIVPPGPRVCDGEPKAKIDSGLMDANQEELTYEKMVKETTLVQPDGGLHPWISIIACCALLFLSSGMAKSFNDIKQAITAEFNCSHSVLAMIPGVFSAGALFWAPVSAALIRNFGARLMLAVGCGLCTLGFIISGSADSGEYLVLSLGLFVGTGFSFVANYTVFVIGKLFKERKALALGLALSGGCLGHELLPRIFDLALRLCGPRGVFAFLAVAPSIWIMICLYIVGDPERQMVSQVTMVPAPAEVMVPAPEAKVSAYKKKWNRVHDELGLSMLSDLRFWLIAVSAVFFGLGSPSIGSAMGVYSGFTDYNFGEIFCLVSSVGVRLTYGVWSANSKFDRTAEYALAVFGGTVTLVLLTFLPDEARWPFYLLGSFCSGAWAVLIPATLGFTLGTANIGKSFALVKFCRGLVIACWSIPKSELKDLLGLKGVIWVDFAFCVVAATLAILLYIKEKKKPEPKSPEGNQEKTPEDPLIGILFLYSL